MTDFERQQLEKEFNEKYADDIKRIEERAFFMKKKMEIKKLKREYRKSLGITTTKLLCYYIFIIFNVVLVYSLVAMWHFADLEYLGVIISDIIGQILVYGIYSIRAYKDTKSEELVKLEKEKLNKLPESARDKLEEIIEMMNRMIPSEENNEYTDLEDEYSDEYESEQDNEEDI